MGSPFVADGTVAERHVTGTKLGRQCARRPHADEFPGPDRGEFFRLDDRRGPPDAPGVGDSDRRWSPRQDVRIAERANSATSKPSARPGGQPRSPHEDEPRRYSNPREIRASELTGVDQRSVAGLGPESGKG